MKSSILNKIHTKEHKKTWKALKGDYNDLYGCLHEGKAPGNSMIAALKKAVVSVREAYGMEPHDVQLLSCLGMLKGHVMEVNTGEGKTLIAAIVACAAASLGRQVHIYTPNDYLSHRDAQFTAKIAEKMGLVCGYAGDETDHEVKKNVFQNSHIIYTTERCVIFSYINDNSNLTADQDILPLKLDFLIIDEADSILIDNGETPYVLSGGGSYFNEQLETVKNFASLCDVKVLDHKSYGAKKELAFKLNKGAMPHAYANAHTKQVDLTERGLEELEQYLVAVNVIEKRGDLYSAHGISLAEALKIMLTAYHLYEKDISYVVKEGAVSLIDTHTGRVMDSVRLKGDLHQAIEVKEGVEVQSDSLTKGKTTLESFIRKYSSIAGMTGTASEVKKEIGTFYGLDVMVVPTNRLTVRKDLPNVYASTKSQKHRQIVKSIRNHSSKGQPVLVGAATVEEAEYLSGVLKEENISHQLLTPNKIDKEAEIIGNAGRPGRITVTTNMAGRGTDIKLGFDLSLFLTEDTTEEEAARVEALHDHLRVMAWHAGGLHVIGTERSRSGRVDRQLVGRSGRQGEPGSSQFFVSPEDAIFTSMSKDLSALKGLFEASDAPIIAKLFDKSIRKIQKDIQDHSFSIKIQERKKSNVHDSQMDFYYSFRRELKYADNDELSSIIKGIIESGAKQIAASYIDFETFDFVERAAMEEDLQMRLEHVMHLDIPLSSITNQSLEVVAESISNKLIEKFELVYANCDQDELGSIIKELALEASDKAWISNIARVEDVYQSIHFRSYAGEKPDIQYQKEALKSYQYFVIDCLVNITMSMAALCDHNAPVTSDESVSVNWSTVDFLDKLVFDTEKKQGELQKSAI